MLVEVQAFAKYFPEGPVRDFVENAIGQYDPLDNISVKIGIALWNKYHYAITPQLIVDEIFINRKNYFNVQDINGNMEIERAEVDPVIGKLLPRGMKKGGELIGDWK